MSSTAVQLQHDNFDIKIDRPVTQGGGGAGLMGGQHLLLGIGGCFCSTLFAAAQAREVDIQGLEVNVFGTLSESLPKRFTDVELVTSYTSCSQEDEFPKLLQIAENGCISVNTIKHSMNFKVS